MLVFHCIACLARCHFLGSLTCVQIRHECKLAPGASVLPIIKAKLLRKRHMYQAVQNAHLNYTHEVTACFQEHSGTKVETKDKIIIHYVLGSIL